MNTLQNCFSKSHILIAFAVLFLGNLCVAQNHPFPLDNARWVNKHRSYYLGQDGLPVYTTSWIDKYCASGNDTTINSVAYKQLDFCSTIPATYHGALRYDSGQVYFVPKDSLNESLLYDFTLNTGDLTNVILQDNSGSNPNYYMYPVTIGQIDTIIVNGTPRRRLNAENFDWIEGIGCISGLFMEPWINVSNYTRELICMSVNDTTHYLTQYPLEIGQVGACELTLNIEDNSQNYIDLKVAPNPTSGKIIIKKNEGVKITEVNLANTLGALVKRYSGDIEEIEIIGDAGVYFLEIITSEGSKSVVKVLKQ